MSAFDNILNNSENDPLTVIIWILFYFYLNFSLFAKIEIK